MKSIFFTLFVFASLFISGLAAQPTGCYDGSEYVNFKNVGVYGGYTLQAGILERAAQTYQYLGTGTLSNIRIYGEYPGIGPIGGFTIPLRVVVYAVDANGRPSTVLSSRNIDWTSTNEFFGFKDVTMSPLTIQSNFAVAVELRSFTDQFRVDYTGDGEGLNEDLASLTGTSTGFNWSSALTNFSKNGDFRIVPYINSDLVADFNPSSNCVAVGQTISFSNFSQVEKGGMLNVINRNGYSGSNTNYLWNFGDGTTSTLANPTKSYSTAGRKTITLTVKHQKWDGSVCTDVHTHDISVGLGLTATNIVNASCHGLQNGSATATASGGATPYKYFIDGGPYVTNSQFNNLAPGSHTMVVEDALGCQSAFTFNINQPTVLAFSSTLTTSSNCGQSNGAILVVASGGTGAITYSLNTGPAQSSGSFTGLASGPYSVRAIDANGCSTKVSLVINDQGAPTIILSAATNISCNGGSDGTITLLGSGGTGLLQYSVNGVNYQSSGVFTGLSADTYTVTVKDAAGCIRGFTINLTEPPVLQIGRVLLQQPVSCFGSSDGILEVTNSIGGIGVPTYSINGINFQSGRVFSGLSQGTYTVTVRDAAGCTATTTATVTEPNPLLATATVTFLSCFESNDGSITVTVSGGNKNYQYQLSGSGIWQSSNTFYNLPAGNYTVLVRDSKDCSASVSVSIVQPTTIAASISTGAATCGGNDGTASIIASGGSGTGYTYSINQGSSFQSNGSFTNLSGGTYSVIIRDGSGCQNSYTFNINSTTGPSITNINKTDVTCYNGSDGSITATVSGGTGSIQYSIGGDYQSSSIFTNLSAGFYTVSVRDAVGCYFSDTITLRQGAPINISTVVNSNVSCYGGNNGSVTVNAAGGIGSLAYSLNGINYQSTNTFNGLSAGILYHVIVRDAGACTNFSTFSVNQPPAIITNIGETDGNCAGSNNGSIYVIAGGGTGTISYSFNGSNYSSTNTWSNLAPGSYIVSVRDANNCTVLLNSVVSEPSPLALNAVLDNVNCAGGNDGAISLNTSGGVPPYRFTWSNGSNTDDIFNLEEGSYSVLVRDANNCVYSGTYTVLAPATPLIINSVINPSTGTGNDDGSIDITVTGGTAPYSFDWSNGSVSEDLDSIVAGFYIIVVTDASGCETTEVIPVSVGSSVILTDKDNQHLLLYPNPASDFVNIELKGLNTNLIENIRLTNNLGQQIVFMNLNTDKYALNTNDLIPGFYFLQVESEGKIISKKFSVQR